MSVYSEELLKKHQRLIKGAKQELNKATSNQTPGVKEGNLLSYLGKGAKGLLDRIPGMGSAGKASDEVAEGASDAMQGGSRIEDVTPVEPGQPTLKGGLDDGADSASGGGGSAIEDVTPLRPGQSALKGGAGGEAVEEGGSGLGGTLLAGGAGLGLGGAGYGLGYNQGEEAGQENRNLAFGAGLATGAVTPEVTQRAYDIYQNT